jgi:hypothetical protein
MAIFSEDEIKIIDDIIDWTFASGDIDISHVKLTLDESIKFILEDIPVELGDKHPEKLGSVYLCLKYFKHILKDM